MKKILFVQKTQKYWKCIFALERAGDRVASVTRFCLYLFTALNTTIYTSTHQHVWSCCVQSKGSLWIRLPPPNYAQLWPMFHFLANIVIKEGKLNKFRRAHKLLINILRKTMIKQPGPWDLLFGGEEARRRVSNRRRHKAKVKVRYNSRICFLSVVS